MTRSSSRLARGLCFVRPRGVRQCKAQGGIEMTISSHLQRSRKYSWLPRTAAAFIGCLAAAGASAAGERLTENPYAPAYGHAYRHGAVPTREAAQRMRAWEAVRHVLGRPAFLGFPGLNTRSYGGGIDGIGVTSGTPMPSIPPPKERVLRPGKPR